MLFNSMYGLSPFSDFRRLQREMNRLFDGYGTDIDEFPAVNVWSGQDEIVVTAEVPGVDPKDLSINVNQDVLTLEGKRQSEDLQDGVVCHRCERGQGAFSRSLRLPFEIDADGVKARHKLGVLTIKLPRAEAGKPRKIAISTEK